MAELKFLVFGAGFSGLAALEAVRGDHPQAILQGTTRDTAKAEQLRSRNIDPLDFDGSVSNAVANAIASATHILISIAPGPDGDPVLKAASPLIENAPRLQWIGYYSTIGVYGDADGAWIDETFPVQPLNARIAWRLEAEARWRALAAERQTPLAILRLAGIYGRCRSAFDKLRAGTARRIVKPGQVFNRIHNEDIGAITARAATARLAGIFNITDDEPAPPQDVIAYGATLLGIAPPLEVEFDSAELSPMARSFYSGNRRVRNDAIKAALGYHLRYPTYREGLAAILASEHAAQRDR